MIQCQHCGQVNSVGSNFCRFCGLKFTQLQPQIPLEDRVSYEDSPPRPYSWKTDEFELKQQKQTKPINRVQSLIRQPPQPTQNDLQRFNQHPVPYKQNLMPYGYSCPRCSSQSFPRIEKKISTAGWIVFAVLLMTIFPLFWIGFLIKEEVKVCPVCNFRVNY
ncbi:MAG: LITAF-like zinc ribbon domain-containing protein [Aridibacter sp.]